MTSLQVTTPEFSRSFAIENIEAKGTAVELVADTEERRRLAERFDLLALNKLIAHLEITRGASGIPVRVRGRLQASVVQRCVVSLEPVASEIDEPVEAEYNPASAEESNEIIHLDQPDPPEPLEGDSVELGELVAQHLSVALDPYPRKEAAEPPKWGNPADNRGDAARDSPFSVLASFRKKRG